MRYRQVSAAPVRDANGSIIGSVSVVRDITERKRVEEELKESEARFRGLFENLPVPVFLRRLVFDGKGEIVDRIRINANRAGLKILEVGSIDEVKGKRDSEIYGPEMAAGRLDTARKVRAEGRPITVELHLDPNDRDYLTTLAPLGKDHVISTSVDITEIKRAERSLKESETKYRGLFENLQEEAVIYEYIYDDSGQLIDAKLLDANPLWLKVNGIDLDEARGRRHSQLFGRKFFEETLPILHRIKELGGSIVLERPFPPGGPESRLSYFPLDKDRFIVTIVDISQIKSAQRAVEEYSEELKRSNTDLQQFAYIASHDLKEPLRMVTSYLHLLEKKNEGKLDDSSKEYMKFAVDGAMRMKAIIDDLLTFSQVETKGKTFALVDMNEVLSIVENDLMTRIKESGGLLTHEDLPIVTADRSQMIQLLENLVGNAIKYLRDVAAPQIHVSVNDRGEEWVFSVQDNGTGIQPEPTGPTVQDVPEVTHEGQV